MITRTCFTRFLFLVCAGFICCSALEAQVGTSGTILGAVRDETGAVIPDVTVIVTDENTGIVRNTSTNELGLFRVPSLLPSSYLMEAEMVGFKKYVRQGILLSVNQSIRLDIQLDLGEITERVEVTEVAPLLQTNSSTVGTVVDSKKVRELPLNGRNFIQLTLLIPGAVQGNNAGGFFVIGGGSPSVSGNRSEMNNFTLDGVSNNEHFFKFEAVQPSVDSIQEFKVQTNITSAQFGSRAGANVNVATKGGTNEFHGVVFEFIRNDNLDATDFFATRKPEFKQNQFGANVGGPILKNRTFFFASYEALRFRRNQNIFSIIPTASQIGGDLSLTHTGDVAPTIFDPLSTTGDPNNADSFMREPFPDNRIPSARLDPITQAYHQLLYPSANLQPNPGSTSLGPGLSNNVNNNSYERDDNQILWRVDHRISDNNQLYVRFADSKRALIEPLTLQTVSRHRLNTFHNLALSDTLILSPNTILDVKFGYIRDNLPFTTPIPEPGIGVVFAAGLQGVPETVPPAGDDFPVTFNIPGFAGPGLGVFVAGPQVTTQGRANLLLTRGRHAINMGFDFRHEEILHDGQFGRWHFDSIPTAHPQRVGSTGQPLAGYLLGLPSIGVRIVGTTAADIARNLYHTYIQDDITISGNLTINLGFRYELTEWFRGDYEGGGSHLAWFDIRVRPDDPNPLNRGKYVWEGPNPITGEGPNTRPGFLEPDYNNFAPRIGLAYRLGDKSTIRAGYGIYYESNFVWEGQSARGNWPYAANQTVSLNRAFGDPLVSVARVFPELDLNKVPLGVGQTQDRLNRTPYVQQWNINLQYGLTPTTLLDVGYIGNKGTHLNQWVEQNTTLPSPESPEGRRPFPINNTPLRISHHLGNSTYNALQVKLEKQFSQGLSFLSSYAWGRTIDIGSNRGYHSMNRFNLNADRALADFHSSHVYALSWVWELPFGRNRAFGSGWSSLQNGVLGGWQLTGIVSARAGRPVNPQLTFDNANIGQGVLRQRPNVTRNPNLAAGQQTSERFFDTEAFQLPARFTFGNSGRNVIIGPGVHRWDLGIYKDFQVPPLGEAGRIQFRAELFNAFNGANFAQPGSALGTPAFGRITSSEPARQVQFALKVFF